MDKYGNFLMDLNDDFNLYRIIAKNVKSAVPKNQINKLIFKEFIVEKESIINDHIYNYQFKFKNVILKNVAIYKL